MDIPALTQLPARLLSECGIVSGVLVAAVVWLTITLTRKNASYDKLVHEQNEAYEKLGELRAKVDALLLVARAGAGHDDD